MKMPYINESKLVETMEIIDKIANIFENDSNVENNQELVTLEECLKKITGKSDIQSQEFAEYWSWTELEELARSVLMPNPVFQGLTDKELSDIIIKISECEYSESETDYYIKVLECETGLDNISDYIFYPDEMGLDIDAEVSEIIAKILSDRKEKF